MTPSDRQALIRHLSALVTQARWQKIQAIARQRTRHLTVVLEDLYQPHNASAVLRSCDAFGVQDVYLVENRNEFAPNKGVSVGADRWLTLHRYNAAEGDNLTACLDDLKARGYCLAATVPTGADCALPDLPTDAPLALLFGTELTGLSPEALARADRRVTIPMSGFVESFNISVSVALCLYDLTVRLRRSETDWRLGDEELAALQLHWLRQTLNKSHPAIEAEFWAERGGPPPDAR